ncbi:MAG TPA: transcription-repair coupling factor [Bacilli bacterium]|jgi:transcription-repair coupling factor (superfamily II helicase)|nr:transcription-repair coupling factor [Bacilli bacterium]HPV55153.1 transcription-repair coupling factor [Bacilli bacterium]HQM17800.1 transcription-repair coupling factor [Bacilli bacterium]
MNNILELFKINNSVIEYEESIKDNSSIYLYNVVNNAKYLAAYDTYVLKGESIIYIASNLYKANQAYNAFLKLAGDENVDLYAVDEIISADLLVVSNDLKIERINTLKNILEKKAKIIVTHVQAVLKPLISPELFKKQIINLKKNKIINREELIKQLVIIGYNRTPITFQTGDFSVRGEVIDIFPILHEKPVRVTCFDDEIESIRFFDVKDQLSLEKIEEIDIYPIQELIYNEEQKKEVISKLKKYNNPHIQELLKDVENHKNDERVNKLINYFYDKQASLLDYQNSLTFYDEYNDLKNVYKKILVDIQTQRESLELQIELLYTLEFEAINKPKQKVYLEQFSRYIDVTLDKVIDFKTYSIIDYQNDLKNLIFEIKLNKQKTYVLTFKTIERLKLFKKVIEEGFNYLEIESFEDIEENKVHLIVVENPISFGFIDRKLEVISEEDIFKDLSIKKPKKAIAYQGKTIFDKDELKLGDYIVHYDYGLAIYQGIKTVELNGLKQDYLTLKFSNSDLLVPVENINLISKYVGSEGVVPKLNKLGTKSWEKKRKRIKEQLVDIATVIIENESERSKAVGYKYLPDDEFQRIIESDFPHEETLDQIAIIENIKAEMEDGKVIDRLVCGDVGFGKTEIALRTAVKTVINNKQAAYLAPTTILSNQHYHTFKNRLEPYGIRVELLNRLVPLRKQREVIEDTKKGLVDILIGTHRILSDDVGFYDLGLLIVDEEQRFGVMHKEKIKTLKKDINILTLTATPIPRTLHIAISGIKSLSLLETPPKSRYPIQTYVLSKNDTIIKEAIYRELNHGGQIFYLHNQISTLHKTAINLKRLVPEARIVIAHGQMNKEELEDNVASFINLEYDILLCTTIIETGIDIPNANTLIIEDADHLGLAQIYQIRGRVGRSDRIAYAFLMYDNKKILTETAYKRLEAIKEFTTLGSGFNIAIRDLSIRGAGDLLGKEQSGFIDSVGLDLYLKLLEEAIEDVKGIKKTEPKSYSIKVSKFVDDSYVSDDELKIMTHKEIGKIENKKDKDKIISIFTDRFGELSNELLLYIESIYLNALLLKYDIDRIVETKLFATVIFTKEKTKQLDMEKVFMVAYNISNDFHFEYRQDQLLLKLSKEVQSKNWIYTFTSFFENLK